MTSPPPAAEARLCEVGGCGRRHFARGYCRAHHERWRRHGDPQAHVPIAGRERGGDGYRAVGRRLRSELGPASGRRRTGNGLHSAGLAPS